VGSIALKRVKKRLRLLEAQEETLRTRHLKIRRICKGKRIRRNKIIRPKELHNLRKKTSNPYRVSNSSTLT
jgi:hypothetical protein